MTVTNEFERDLINQAHLKRAGRVDMIVFQNLADVGDGSPGIQRCFRNYLHEGGMEKDLDLIGYGIKGTSVDISNVELQQLSNIGGAIISGAQWGYVGGANQPVKIADSPTFGGLTINGHITITGNVDGVDVSVLKNSFDTHKASNGTDHSYIDQSVIEGSSPVFTNLNLADDIIHVGDTNNLISFGTDTQDYQTGGSSRMDISDSGVRFGGSGVRITGIIDDDDLGTSDVVLCTQGNTKAYVDAQSIHAIPSDDLVFSNDTSRNTTSTTYVKLKEIAVYLNVNLRICWEYWNGSTPGTVYTKLYINGVAVGSEKSTTSGVAVPVSEDVEINNGDLLQIYGKVSVTDSPNCYISNMRINFIEYVSNDP